MGVFSRYHRFHEAGEEANINNTERFGYPIKSLFTTTKVFTLHHHIDITDEKETVLYQANTKFPSIHDKTDITDAEGKHIAHIERIRTMVFQKISYIIHMTAVESGNEIRRGITPTVVFQEILHIGVDRIQYSIHIIRA